MIWRCFIGVLCCLTVISCDLFKTRTPEEPSQVSSNYVPPTDPSLVFQNMVYAFQDMNSVNYVRSFADTMNSAYFFVFEPTATARSNNPGVFVNWTKQSESQYFENIRAKLQSGSIHSLEFSSLTEHTTPDSVQYDATYQLIISVQPHDTIRVKGRAQFVLIMDRSGSWAVRYWLDISPPNSTDSTWSDLKARFAQ